MKKKTTKFFNNEERNWVLIDAKDRILGRLATRIAIILQGKNKATYTPNFLCGDRVIVINAKHIKVTGTKNETKIYDKYTGYNSGRKEMVYKVMKEKNPELILKMAVKGMLPRNNLGRQMIRALKINAEAEHGQEAQMPKIITV
ncbi:MAG: 50S ribosomal protein L13 [Candidatus Omnitrophica bacterium]|nr:50S ribosomal protein L13 [Candidatus Omnitrophota bacterium]MCK5393207.1 50S ribosomal protein L13 [Candidatus Omnitrophota bacterium]